MKGKRVSKWKLGKKERVKENMKEYLFKRVR